MPADPDRTPGEPGSEERASLRDAGLRRLRDARRWIAGGAVVLTGAFAGLAALASKHDGSATASASSAGSQQASQAQGTADGNSFDEDNGFGDDGGGVDRSGGGARLQGPSQLPEQAPGSAAPHSSSGAS
jgi:hypothetical protein